MKNLMNRLIIKHNRKNKREREEELEETLENAENVLMNLLAHFERMNYGSSCSSSIFKHCKKESIGNMIDEIRHVLKKNKVGVKPGGGTTKGGA